MNLASMTPVAIFTLLNVAMALGLYITAMSGQLSMATAAIAGVGGYLAAVLTVKFGWALLPATFLAAIAGASVGTMLALLTLKMRDFILKLTTLAFGEALSVLAFNWEYIGGANSFTGIGLKTSLWTAAAAALISLYVAWRFDGSRLGFACRAVRDDPIAASAMGVSIALARSVSFALGGALVGLAGAIQAHYVLVVSPARSWFFRLIEFHHLLAVRRPADIVGADARCRAAHRVAGDAPLHQRIPAYPLRSHHRGGRPAPTGGVIDAHTPGAGVETLRIYAQVGPSRRRDRRRPALTATALLIGTRAGSSNHQGRRAIAAAASLREGQCVD